MSKLKKTILFVAAVVAYFAVIAATLAMLPPASGAEQRHGVPVVQLTRTQAEVTFLASGAEPFTLIETQTREITPPPVGSFFATRNAPGNNKTPGSHWNHIAIMGPNSWVIEAQSGPGFIIAVKFEVFYLRYPEIACFRPKRTPPEIGGAVASAAAAQMGREYHRITNNCVSVARRAVGFVQPRKPLRWRRPDDVLKNADVIYWKKNEPNTPTLAEPFQGATKNPNDLAR